MHWQIKATAESVARPVKMTGDEETLKFYNAYGVAIDNNPESPYFGRIYVASSKGGTSAGRTTDQGIYIMDPLFGDITNQSNKAYDGGITWSSSNSPFRLAIAPDGRVFMCDFSDGNSGIYVMDPSKPDGKIHQPVRRAYQRYERTCQQYKQRTRTRLFLLLLRDGKQAKTQYYILLMKIIRWMVKQEIYYNTTLEQLPTGQKHPASHSTMRLPADIKLI